ncbi:cyclin-T-like [Sitodiplosis mosellana]|uniref:cyclin-T-like n=1 Tax=Sitodiplosis mosellana TaxID=263140 RepID=UPI0024441534|nr:cyclin-T-like [Sitodiplosis mosellana]
MASGSGSSGENSQDSRWYFTAAQLQNSPSRSQGIDAEKEIELRQQAACLIQEMGQRLRVDQSCINTAIVYMHRFYVFHSFAKFHQNGIAMASLLLAAKVKEQPRTMESVTNAAQACTPGAVENRTSEAHAEQEQDLVFNENVLLHTLGFDVHVKHPHMHIVKTCYLIKACEDLTHTAYALASNSLHLTTMCLQYRPTVVACFCINLACKWTRWEIPQSTEGMDWFYYVDKNVTMELLEQLQDEFMAIYERSPARLKNKLCSTIRNAMSSGRSTINSQSGTHNSGPRHRSSSHHSSEKQLIKIDNRSQSLSISTFTIGLKTYTIKIFKIFVLVFLVIYGIHGIFSSFSDESEDKNEVVV